MDLLGTWGKRTQDWLGGARRSLLGDDLPAAEKRAATVGTMGPGLASQMQGLDTAQRAALKRGGVRDLLGDPDVQARATDVASNLDFTGTFGGVKAKTADLGALAKAEELAKAGTDPADIWQQTGWFRAPDGQWRWEIDDSKADLHPMAGNQVQRWDFESGINAKEALPHPDLYAAYPELADIRTAGDVNSLSSHMRRGSYEGGYSPPIDQFKVEKKPGGLVITRGGEVVELAFDHPSALERVAELNAQLGDRGNITVRAKDRPTGRSVMLHELQHGVQNREGFATGANTIGLRPKTPAWDIYQERLKAIVTPPSLEEFATMARYDSPDAARADWLEHVKTLEGYRKKGVPDFLDRAAQETAVSEAYRRSAGEAEARAVQARRDLLPEQRRARPPWLDYDVPPEQQIVRGVR